MKKTVSILLILFTVLGIFVACSKGDTLKTTEGNTTSDAAALPTEITTVTRSSDTTSAANNRSAQSSTTAANNATDTAKKTIIFGSKWPTNDLIKLIPKPDFGIQTSSSLNKTYANVSLMKVTKDDFTHYVAKLKASGFTVNASQTDTEGMLFFSAKNSAGTSVCFDLAKPLGTSIITVTAAK